MASKRPYLPNYETIMVEFEAWVSGSEEWNKPSFNIDVYPKPIVY